MWKEICLVLVILAILVYSRVVENYQNFSYYPGHGDPIYSGVTQPETGASYTGEYGEPQTQQQQGYY